METKVIRYAPTAWRLLEGILCVYKPSFMSMNAMRYTLTNNLITELEELDHPEVKPYVSISGDTTKPLTVEIRPSFADHTLMTGPRYSSIGVKWPIVLGDKTSGVCILGLLKDGAETVKQLYGRNFIRTYRISGRFGLRTNNLFIDGKVKYVGNYEYIKQHVLDRLLATIQATYQKRMFQLCGVDEQSQTAYELASRGPIRVMPSEMPVVYSMKCAEFNLPDFTLEVTCVNENEDFLVNMISEIGIKLRAEATCTSVRCIRYAMFTLDDALLRKHWQLEHVIGNINQCEQKIHESDLLNAEPTLKIVKT